MKYNILGKTDLRVSRLCLGCMTFGEPNRGNHAWTLPEESSRPIIKHALEGGINFFDTANSYSAGSSEEIVGRALRDFARRVADVLPYTELGVQVCGDLDAPVNTVAVLPGSGDSLFDEVRATGADVYVTSDLRHHPVTDAIEQARYEASMRASGIALGHGDEHVRPAFINTPHSAIESMWFQYAMKDVPQTVASVTGDTPDVRWISMNTDPWNMVIPSSGQER